MARGLAGKLQPAFPIDATANVSTSSNSTISAKSLLPIIPHRIPKPFYPSQDTGPPVTAEVNTTDLASEPTHRYAELRTMRERRQVTPDAITELGLSEEHRRFLVGYDCSKPMDVKPMSSFIHDPCEPAEANNKETYEIQPVTQFQIG